MSNITLGFAAAPFALTQTCHTLVALLSWVIVVTARFFVLPLLQHWNIWWVDSPTLLWDPALMCWLLSCFSMVTMEIFARANNCSLSSRCGCFLSWTNKRLWVAFRDDHQKGTSWPCSFVIRHGGRILQKQLLHKIFFSQCFPLAIHPLNAAGPSSAVSFLHPGNNYLSTAKIFSGYLDDCAIISGSPLYGSAMAQADIFEWWKLKVTLGF